MKKQHFFKILIFVLLLSACTTGKYEVKPIAYPLLQRGMQPQMIMTNWLPA